MNEKRKERDMMFKEREREREREREKRMRSLFLSAVEVVRSCLSGEKKE